MTDSLNYHKQANGVGILTFDQQGERVNTLSSATMTELSTHLSVLEKDTDLKVLVIKSAKPGIFIVGADITEFKSIKTEEESRRVVEKGQGVFMRIQNLPFPTITAIQGVCLGGGLELALSCDFRIVSDSERVMLGLPEVNLGIIPGWGGTQRLPRLIGFRKGLEFILSGKPVPGQKAAKLGLADICVSDAFFDSRLNEFIGRVVKEDECIRLKARQKRRSFIDATSLGRLLIAMLAKKTVMKKTRGAYPAPLAAIKAVRSGFSRRIEDGLEKEALCFTPLPLTDVSRHLVRLFFIQENLRKDSGVIDPDIQSKSVGETSVLGAGLMGGGIAWLLSYKGYSVRLKDVAWPALAKGIQSARNIYGQLLKKRRIKEHQSSLGMHRISCSTGFEGFKKMDLVIEAIVENMDIKKQVFQSLESNVHVDTIIATNTSSLSVTEMATVLTRPQNFVGMHFFSPVNRMPLVEIIPGEKTSDTTIATIVAMTKRLKKTAIVVKDCPGFLVNRILIPYVNEAVFCLQDGAKIDRIDALMEKFGMPLGPLSLADEVGLDVGYKVAKVLHEGYGDRMQVAPLFDSIYKNKELRGKKSGLGFYEHEHAKKKVNPMIGAIIKMDGGYSPRRLDDADIVDRLILIMVNEAAKCLEESVVGKVEYLDMAMLLGAGFPPFRGGLCAYVDYIGVETIVLRLKGLSDLYGSRFKPADLLVTMAEEGIRFYA